MTSVRVGDIETDTFPIMIGLHQGLALSLYIFSLVMDEVTMDIKEIFVGLCSLLMMWC